MQVMAKMTQYLKRANAVMPCPKHFCGTFLHACLAEYETDTTLNFQFEFGNYPPLIVI